MSSIEFLRYWRKEMEQANDFSNNLSLKEDDFRYINSWIKSWIDISQQNQSGNEQDNNFYNIYDSLDKTLHVLEDNSLKFLLCRLIKLYDLTWGGVLPSAIDGATMEIKRFIKFALSSKPVFRPSEFTSFLSYLIGTPVSPNSDIFDYIWLIENQSKFFKTSDYTYRNKALRYLLDLNAVRGFHHNIKDFKKILSFIKPDNIDTIQYLSKYKVKNMQGCYQVINYIFNNLNGELYECVEIKIELISWLDNASGSSPKKPWLDKLASIKNKIKEDDLLEIAEWIITNSYLEREENTGWLDDVYKRFLKSSKWYINSIR